MFPQAVRVHARVSGVDITCSTDWAYTWSFFSGSGKATVEGAENAVDVALELASSLSLDRAAPTKATVQVGAVSLARRKIFVFEFSDRRFHRWEGVPKMLVPLKGGAR